jgi:hypothetical protein
VWQRGERRGRDFWRGLSAAHPIDSSAAELVAAKLAAAADVRLEVEEHARNAPALQLLRERRQHAAEVGEDLLVAAGADVLVSASALFGKPNVALAAKALLDSFSTPSRVD